MEPMLHFLITSTTKMEFLGGLELFAASRGFDDPIDLVVALGTEAFHDHILHVVWVGDTAEEEVILFRGGLNLHIAEVENGRDHPTYFRGYILDAREFQLAHGSDEKALLLDVDDALIGDDPNIEKVVDPDEKSVEPDEEDERVLDEEYKSEHLGTQSLRIEEGNEGQRAEEHRDKEYDHEEMRRDIEPVPMNNTEHRFALALTLEMIAAKVVIRHS